MRFWKIVLITILAVGMTGAFDTDAMARRGGGGFSSSRSSFSSSRSTPSRSSTWGSKTSTSKSGLSTSGSRKTSVSKPVRSSADTALHAKAAKSGTAYKSKTEATSAFKTKNAAQYKSTYAIKPTTRPDHIPPSTSVGGKSYDVSYNQQHGGYGYMGPSGSWMAYDAMSDAIMLNTLMTRQNYYYDRPGSVRYEISGGGLAWLMWFGIIVFAVICVAAFIAR